MGRRSFTVEVVVSAKNQTQAAFGQLKKGMQESSMGAKLLDGAMLALGQGVVSFASQLPQMIVNLTNTGIQAQAAQRRFEQFAGGTDRATDMLAAFQRGADGTVDRMGAMTSAARLLQMGLVTNADEMETVAALAVKLGDQTKSATDRISDFSLLLANQSIPRLDNFGISSGKVRARIKELQAATADLSREEAFKIAVMEQGRMSLETLGDTSDLTATKIDKIKAALANAGQGFGEMGRQATDAAIETAGGAEKIAASIELLPTTVDRLGVFTQAMLKAGAAGLKAGGLFGGVDDAFEEFTSTVEEGALRMADVEPFIARFSDRTITGYGTRTAEASESTETFAESLANLKRDTGSADRATQDYTISIDDLLTSMGLSRKEIDANALAAREQKKILERLALQAQQLATVIIQVGPAFTDFFREVENSERGFAEDREKIEADHQAAIEKITERGQAKRIWINLTAEQQKLADLKESLEIALAGQREFTDRTGEATRLRKDRELRILGEQIAAQETLIDNFQAGRLFRAGENIDELLAQQNGLHDDQLLALEEAQAAQEEAQRQALGRLVLQSFEAWAAMKDIPAEKMIEMRTTILEEFGLIDTESARVLTLMTRGFEDWADGFDTSAADVIGATTDMINKIGGLGDAILGIPNRDVLIRVRVDTSGGLRPNEPRPGGPMIDPGIVTPSAGNTTVVNNNDNRSFGMNVTTQATTPSVIEDFELAEAMMQ